MNTRVNERQQAGRGVPLLLALTLGGWLAAGSAHAAATEEIIRALEQQQTHAALTGDGATLAKIFAPDFRIVNPTGAIGTGEQLLKLLTSGSHPYTSAKYQTELVRDLGTVVVTVGMEEVVPAQGPQAGQTVHRRVTQVWKREHGQWVLTLRHAMVVATPGG